MRDTYSLYEAKAQLSALVRKVREGRSVVITLRGEPVAEMRPVGKRAAGLASLLDDLEERGVLVRPTAPGTRHTAVTRRPGALRRFLDERD